MGGRTCSPCILDETRGRPHRYNRQIFLLDSVALFSNRTRRWLRVWKIEELGL